MYIFQNTQKVENYTGWYEMKYIILKINFKWLVCKKKIHTHKLMSDIGEDGNQPAMFQQMAWCHSVGIYSV